MLGSGGGGVMHAGVHVCHRECQLGGYPHEGVLGQIQCARVDGRQHGRCPGSGQHATKGFVAGGCRRLRGGAAQCQKRGQRGHSRHRMETAGAVRGAECGTGAVTERGGGSSGRTAHARCSRPWRQSGAARRPARNRRAQIPRAAVYSHGMRTSASFEYSRCESSHSNTRYCTVAPDHPSRTVSDTARAWRGPRSVSSYWGVRPPMSTRRSTL